MIVPIWFVHVYMDTVMFPLSAFVRMVGMELVVRMLFVKRKAMQYISFFLCQFKISLWGGVKRPQKLY